MMPRAFAWLWLLIATVFIAACASSAPTKDENANALTKAAQNIERRASQSFAKGEFDSAAAGYES
jgi:PBP1b-binding outer membrane lipoprotein LpoB